MKTLKESILISKARKGDADAFKKIYQLLADGIYRFVYYRLPDKEIAKDTLQDVFLRLWNYINQQKEIKNLKALTYQIAKNLVADYYRKNNLENLGQKVELERVDIDYEISDESNIVKEIDIKSQIKKAKIQISKIEHQEYREIIELKYFDQLSVKEIGKILNKDANNVRVILHRALKKLKQIIEEDEQ